MAKIELNFKIKEGIKPVDEMTEEELQNAPVSAGFYYSIDEGGGSDFVELLEDEDTKKKCYEAINILSKLERVTEDYIQWM